MGQATGDFNQKNNVDNVTLDNFDLSAKNGAQDDDTQDNFDPLDFIVSSHQIHTHFKLLPDYCAFKQLSFVVKTHYSIKTRAPPHFAFA